MHFWSIFIVSLLYTHLLSSCYISYHSWKTVKWSSTRKRVRCQSAIARGNNYHYDMLYREAVRSPLSRPMTIVYGSTIQVSIIIFFN